MSDSGQQRQPARIFSKRAALVTLVRAGYRATLIYRAGFFFAVVSVVIQVLVLVLVWRAAYADRPVVAGVSEATTVGYAALAASMQALVAPRWIAAIGERIRVGQIGVDIIRPLSLMTQSLAQSVGALLASCTAAAAGIIVGLFLGALRAPANPAAGAAWLFSLLLGLSIALVANLTVSLLAFWTLSLEGPTVVYQFGSMFLSGALIPLWFMPDGLRAVLTWLPFQYQVYAPTRIWLGEINGAGIIRVLGLQLVWILAMWFVAQLVWHRAVRRVVILGG